jgi:hypothetical protein
MVLSLLFPHKAVREMAFENIALRQQLSVFRTTVWVSILAQGPP